MPIREMQRYAVLRERGDDTSLERRKILEEHRAVIVAQIEALEKAHSLLTHKIENYRLIEERIRVRRPSALELESDRDLAPAV